jgi:hypothetical protein
LHCLRWFYLGCSGSQEELDEIVIQGLLVGGSASLWCSESERKSTGFTDVIRVQLRSFRIGIGSSGTYTITCSPFPLFSGARLKLKATPRKGSFLPPHVAPIASHPPYDSLKDPLNLLSLSNKTSGSTTSTSLWLPLKIKILGLYFVERPPKSYPLFRKEMEKEQRAKDLSLI